MIDIDKPTEMGGGGGKNRHKGAASRNIDMVWLYRSPIPVDSKGAIFHVNLKSTCLNSQRLEKGEESVSTLWGWLMRK